MYVLTHADTGRTCVLHPERLSFCVCTSLKLPENEMKELTGDSSHLRTVARLRLHESVVSGFMLMKVFLLSLERNCRLCSEKAPEQEAPLQQSHLKTQLSRLIFSE